MTDPKEPTPFQRLLAEVRATCAAAGIRVEDDVNEQPTEAQQEAADNWAKAPVVGVTASEFKVIPGTPFTHASPHLEGAARKPYPTNNATPKDPMQLLEAIREDVAPRSLRAMQVAEVKAALQVERDARQYEGTLVQKLHDASNRLAAAEIQVQAGAAREAALQSQLLDERKEHKEARDAYLRFQSERIEENRVVKEAAIRAMQERDDALKLANENAKKVEEVKQKLAVECASHTQTAVSRDYVRGALKRTEKALEESRGREVNYRAFMNAQSQRDAARKERDEALSTLANLPTEHARVMAERDDHERTASDLNKSLEVKTQELEDEKAEHAEAMAEVKRLTGERDALQTRINDLGRLGVDRHCVEAELNETKIHFRKSRSEVNDLRRELRNANEDRRGLWVKVNMQAEELARLNEELSRAIRACDTAADQLKGLEAKHVEETRLVTSFSGEDVDALYDGLRALKDIAKRKLDQDEELKKVRGKLDTTRSIIRATARILDPECPDLGAYEDGHCSLMDLVGRTYEGHCAAAATIERLSKYARGRAEKLNATQRELKECTQANDNLDKEVVAAREQRDRALGDVRELKAKADTARGVSAHLRRYLEAFNVCDDTGHPLKNLAPLCDLFATLERP